MLIRVGLISMSMLKPSPFQLVKDQAASHPLPSTFTSRVMSYLLEMLANALSVKAFGTLSVANYQCSLVGIRFVLRTAPSHVSFPQVKIARWPKAGK